MQQAADKVQRDERERERVARAARVAETAAAAAAAAAAAGGGEEVVKEKKVRGPRGGKKASVKVTETYTSGYALPPPPPEGGPPPPPEGGAPVLRPW